MLMTERNSHNTVQTISTQGVLPCWVEGTLHHHDMGNSMAHRGLHQEETTTPQGVHSPQGLLAFTMSPWMLPSIALKAHHSRMLHCLPVCHFCHTGFAVVCVWGNHHPTQQQAEREETISYQPFSTHNRAIVFAAVLWR